MASNWTDAELFTASDINPPEIFSGVANNNFHDDVKRDFQREIEYYWRGVGKSTQTTEDDFDIEQIENPEILKDTALEWNNLRIAKYYATTITDLEDPIAQYYQFWEDRIGKRLEMDVSQLTFAAPEGINQRVPFSTPIGR